MTFDEYWQRRYASRPDYRDNEAVMEAARGAWNCAVAGERYRCNEVCRGVADDYSGLGQHAKAAAAGCCASRIVNGKPDYDAGTVAAPPPLVEPVYGVWV